MKAAIFQKLHAPLALETVPDPEPGPRDVIVKVGRCGICGTDLHVTEDPTFNAQPGMILGHEFAGEIVAAGREVSRVKIGDRVVVLPLETCGECGECKSGRPARCEVHFKVSSGGYGEFARATEQQCIALPESVSLEDGALVEPLAVGLHAINISAMQSGARVLVIGAGPIGLAVTYWARRMGAGRVAVTASSTRREALAMEMGASVFVPPAEDLPGAIAAVNSALGGPPEIVFECVGIPGLIQRSIDHVAKGGRVVFVGLCTQPDTFSPLAAFRKDCIIQPSAFYATRDFHTTLDVLNAGDVTPLKMVTDRVSLTELPTAFEALKSRTHQCKVMIDPSMG